MLQSNITVVLCWFISSCAVIIIKTVSGLIRWPRREWWFNMPFWVCLCAWNFMFYAGLSHHTTRGIPLDPISSHLLQAISPTLLPALTHIINTSLLTASFPTAFKQARVTPLLKKPYIKHFSYRKLQTCLSPSIHSENTRTSYFQPVILISVKT